MLNKIYLREILKKILSLSERYNLSISFISNPIKDSDLSLYSVHASIKFKNVLIEDGYISLFKPLSFKSEDDHMYYYDNLSIQEVKALNEILTWLGIENEINENSIPSDFKSKEKESITKVIDNLKNLKILLASLMNEKENNIAHIYKRKREIESLSNLLEEINLFMPL